MLSSVVTAAVLATLAGIVAALRFGHGLGLFGGLEYLPRVLGLSGAREIGPATSVASATFAVAFWTHGHSNDGVRARLRHIGPIVLPMILLGTAVAFALYVGAGLWTARIVYEMPVGSPTALAPARLGLQADDAIQALAASVLGGAGAALLAWLAFPEMARLGWPLPRKLAVLSVPPLLLLLR